MALTETTRIDKIEWVESNHIQIRTATVIERNGEEISRLYHRHVLVPGADLSQEDPKVQAIANVIWTEEIIANYQASQIREYPPLPDEESII
jgi:hypothetical protein